MSSPDRFELRRRNYDLAQRMIVFGARTATVMHWTGLSEYVVKEIGRRYVPSECIPARRKISFSKRTVTASPRLEAEILAFVYLAMEVDVIPAQMVSDARQNLPSLARGERLMEAFECYAALVPMGQLTLEQAIALVYTYASHRQLSLKRCAVCRDWMLTHRFGRNTRCPFCRKDAPVVDGSEDTRVQDSGP
jgi:hypothetical protein